MRTNTARVAAVIVGLEGIGILAIVIWQLVAIVTGDTVSLESAIALLVLTLVGAVAVLAFAVAVWRGLSWGRSGAIVTQMLIGAVALGAATGAYAHPIVGLALAVPAVIAFVFLLLAARRSGAGNGVAEGEPSD